jgi:hypothetical protein
MNFKRLLDTEMGRFFISLLLGLGLATLFRNVCTGDKCLVFNGPVISELDDKIYKYDGKCYKYTTVASKCNSMKRIVDTPEPPTEPKPVGLGV